MRARPNDRHNAGIKARNMKLSRHCVKRYAEHTGDATTTAEAERELRRLLAKRGRQVTAPPAWFGMKAHGAELFVVLDAGGDQLVLPLVRDGRGWLAVTLVSRDRARREVYCVEAWDLAGSARLPDSLLDHAALQGETHQRTGARLRKLLGTEGVVSDSAPSWVARELADADAYLHIPERIAIALRCTASDHLQVADWWSLAPADLDAPTPPSVSSAPLGAGQPAAGAPTSWVDAIPAPAESAAWALRVMRPSRRVLQRYRERVGGPIQSAAELTSFLREHGTVLVQPPAWLLKRAPVIELYVLVGGEDEPDAWVALLARRNRRGTGKLAVLSCVSKQWYRGGGPSPTA